MSNANKHNKLPGSDYNSIIKSLIRATESIPEYNEYTKEAEKILENPIPIGYDVKEGWRLHNYFQDKRVVEKVYGMNFLEQYYMSEENGTWMPGMLKRIEVIKDECPVIYKNLKEDGYLSGFMYLIYYIAVFGKIKKSKRNIRKSKRDKFYNIFATYVHKSVNGDKEDVNMEIENLMNIMMEDGYGGLE